MSAYSAARPKRAGEAFARAHHGEDASGESPSNKKVKFDMRNPSALAPSAADDDGEDNEALAADVIGGSTRVIKRGAVNIDGYDSDSENENFNARAEMRGEKGGGENVELADIMDNYNKEPKKTGEDDDEVDMFGDVDQSASGKASIRSKLGKKGKDVRFLEEKDIEGQEHASRSGGTVRLDEEESSGDEEDTNLAIQEEDVDEEVGAGGLKKHAPKIDAFNMREEQQEGAFDEAGNYIRKAVDPEAVHDRWMEGVTKKQMKKAAEAQEKREAELRQQQREDDRISTPDLLRTLIMLLQQAETPLEALARFGKSQKGQTKPKKLPKWKQKQNNGADAMDVDTKKEPEDPHLVKAKHAIDAITEAADRLLKRGNLNIYDTEKEMLIREYQKESGEAWVDHLEAKGEDKDDDDEASDISRMWEYRWTDDRDGGAKQGPFDNLTMKAWQDAGYFGEGVEFRLVGGEGWTRVPSFV